MKTKDPKWTPVLTGSVYCSPGCGRGCTIYDFDKANEVARAMAAKLGKQWSGVVWENMGWHSKAVHPTGMAVYFENSRRYWATTDVDGFPQHKAHGSTPERAAKKVAALLVETVQTGSALIHAVYPKNPPIPLFLNET